VNLSAWSIRHPVPAILLFGLLTLLGLGAFHKLRIQNFPDIELPVITVRATLEGAAPGQLETEVARKIEDSVASLGGIENIRTTLTDGSAVVAVEFNIDKDPEIALNEVRNAVDGVRADLPQEMNPPIISKVTTSGRPIVTFTVAAPSMDDVDLSWFVDNDIAKAMLAVKGVGRFSRVGGVDREVRIELDPTRMAALGVTAADVSAKLRQVQQEASGGRSDLGTGMQSFRFLGTLENANQLAELIIPLSDGRSARLSEVATVTDGIAERSALALLNGKEVIGFDITRIKGYGEVEVADAVRKAVVRFQTDHPQVEIRESFNTTAPVEDNYQGSMHLLYEGAALAILVVFWFLRDWRATLVAATALPLSIIPTFLVMQWGDYSLDTLTLLALALVVGILVDDAIVEIENIVRHLRMGKTPFEAAMEAADEIGLAVVATSLTLVAVFLPTAFMGGVPGKFFKPFGMTAAASVVASLMVARLLTPMMAAYFLQPHPERPGESATMRRYLAFAGWCLRHRKTTLVAALIFFVGSMKLLPLLPKGFVPAADRAQTVLRLELPPGSRLEETRAVAEQAIAILEKMPEVVQIFAAVGSAPGENTGPLGGGASADPRQATLTVDLVHRSLRALKQSQVENEMRKRLAAVPGARISLVSNAPGEKLQVTLDGDDPATLNAAAQALERDLRTLKGVGNISSSASLQRPEIHVRPDFARAADLGVTTRSLADTVRIATAGDYAMQLPKLNLPQRQVPIRVRLAESLRHDPTAIRQLAVSGRAGQIPLDAVAEVALAAGPTRIDRLNRKRNITFDVELAGRIIGDVMAEVTQFPSLQSLPAGVGHPESGDAQRMTELFASFGGAMMIGIACIYIVLVLLFHDFLQPTTILAALPLSFGGAFIALLLTHNSFSMPSVIGVLMLMGIVTKNSILLVEYAVMARREQGLTRFDALIDACRKRSRPIIMTTIAMGAGMMPVALGLGAEPSFRAPMAIAVIGGLITSTLLSLLVIPVVYTLVDDLVGLMRRLRGKGAASAVHV